MTLQSFGFVRISSVAMGSTISDEFEILGEQDGNEAPVAKENKTKQKNNDATTLHRSKTNVDWNIILV